jgi:hypothetical protein
MGILSIIITLLLLIILTIIIIYIVLYIRNIKYNNIKGDKPSTPIIPILPLPISGYKYSLNLTGFPINLNKYEIKVTFYSNFKLFIDMNVYNGKGELIAINAFHNNTWKIAEDGYDIIYDPDLLEKIGKTPNGIKCILDPHIKYVKGTPNKIIASGSVEVPLLQPIGYSEEIDECSNTDCS